MYVIYEALVWEHLRTRRGEAADARFGEQLRKLRRWERRATTARRRAERAVGRLATG